MNNNQGYINNLHHHVDHHLNHHQHKGKRYTIRNPTYLPVMQKIYWSGLNTNSCRFIHEGMHLCF